MNIRRWIEPNGLRVVVKEMPHTPIVGATLYVKGGSRAETEVESGLAHFLEHVFFKGTQKYPTARELNLLIEQGGGEWNAATSHETISCYTRVSKESLKTVLGVFSELAFRPLFRDEDIEVERGPVIQEMNESLDDVDDCADRLYRQLAWGTHPLGMEIFGTKERVANFGRGDFLSYHRKCFYPGNMVLSVAGGISAEEVFELTFKYFYDGGYAKAHVFPSQQLSWSPARFRAENKEREQVACILGTQAHEWLSYAAESDANYDYWASQLLFHIIGVGGSSRLFQDVRDDKGLVYTIYSYVMPYSDSGIAATYWKSEAPKALEAFKIVLAEYETICSNGVSGDELARAKNQIKMRWAAMHESSLSSAIALGGSEIYGKPAVDFNDFFEKHVLPIKIDDVMRVAPILLNRKNLKLALAGPVGDLSREFEQILLS